HFAQYPRKAQRSCWRWTPMGRILSRLPYTTWSHIRTRRPLPVRSRLSIDASSCAKPVPKKTKALARRLGTSVLECFLAFCRLVEKKCSCDTTDIGRGVEDIGRVSHHNVLNP